MTPATSRQALEGGESSSPLATRLDLLLRRAITPAQFEADMVQACRLDPEEIWSLLALLDQYHRLGKLPTESFRALKASADRYGLVRHGPHIPELMPIPGSVEITLPPTLGDRAPSALGVGSVLCDRYLLEAVLSSDDHGRIFQALDQQQAGQFAAAHSVALHCTQPTAATFAAALAERRLEFQHAQTLTHPNIISVHELNHDGACIFITMDLVPGETLSALLARRKGTALPRAVALAIIRDVGAALAYAHEHGVVHGDLQPQCVVISASGEVRVRGFGAVRGNSCYASCEQIVSRTTDRRDDLYALACLSYELLHGSHPFERLNAATARSRGLVAARPMLLTRQQWRTLRAGLAWPREARHMSVARWLGRMRLARAAKRLPALANLTSLPPSNRSRLRPFLLVVCLAASVAVAASLDRLPTLTTMSSIWNELRSEAGERLRPAAPPAAAPQVPSAGAATPITEPPAANSVPATKNAQTAAVTAAAPTPAAIAITAPARIELTADHYTVAPGDSAARIIVRRSGDLRGDAGFVWWTEGASATANVDFIDWGQRAERVPAGRSSVTLLVPIIKDTTRSTSRTFNVFIDGANGVSKLGGITHATVLLPGSG